MINPSGTFNLVFLGFFSAAASTPREPTNSMPEKNAYAKS
jgi:hypothetical protein